MRDATKITRRTLGTLLVSTSGLAQTAPSADPAQAAKDRIKAAAETLSKQQIPMATEPAFQFKV